MYELKTWCLLLLVMTPLFSLAQENSSASKNMLSPLTEEERAVLTFSESFLLGSEGGSSAIGPPVLRTQQLKGKYDEFVDDGSFFKGVYITGDATSELDGNNSGHAYGLAWELFDQGYYESKRDTGKNKIQYKLRSLRFMQQMLDREQGEQLTYLYHLEGRVELYSNRRLEAFSDNHLILLRQKLDKGFALQSEFDEWAFRLESAQNSVMFYGADIAVSLDDEYRQILNRIELLQLKPIDVLLEQAVSHSYALKIQEVSIQLNQLAPNWKDNLQVRLFVEQRQPYYRSDSENDAVAGVRVRVPIDFSTRHEEIIALDTSVYLQQEKAVREHLQQRVIYLSRQLGLKQYQIRKLISEYRLTGRKIELNQRFQTASIPGLSYTPEKQIPLLELQRINLSGKVLKARIAALGIATKLERLVLSGQVSELFVVE